MDSKVKKIAIHNGNPAVLVKLYTTPSEENIVKCLQEEFEKINQEGNLIVYSGHQTVEQAKYYCIRRVYDWIWDYLKEDFWRYWISQDAAETYFPNMGVELCSAGRSDGWLEVEGLPEVDTWDEDLFEQWETFENDIKTSLNENIKPETWADVVRANEWYKPFSTRFNFIQKGLTLYCVADILADINKYCSRVYNVGLEELKIKI